MMPGPRAYVRRHWPRLRLRTILLATLLFVAALPGVGAVFLRVYENTLVRQTEAELIAQGAVLAATAELVWPGSDFHPDPTELHPEPPSIDLNSSPILPERPAASLTGAPPDAAAVTAARQWLPVMVRSRQTTLASILLLDGRGRIVAGPQAGQSYAGLPEVAAALQGRPDTVLRRNGAYQQVYRFEWLTRAADIRIHYARPVIVGGNVVGVVLLSRSARALFLGLYQDIGKIALGAGAIFLTLVLLAVLLSRGIARPIEELSAATRALTKGHGVPPPVPPTAAIEIQDLYRDFAAMAQAIEQRSRYLRDFAYAVSHEFKTPLAAIAGAIELLQDHAAAMSDDERRQFLANIAADAARLNQLLAGLLDLARADMALPALGEATDIATPLLRVADAYSNGSLKVSVQIADGLPPVRLPPAALETCLSNLLENSRRAGAGNVAIHAGMVEDAVWIDVRDDGPGIGGADSARIFEPFFTTRRHQGGSGLGLAIVRSLLTSHGGGIELLESGQGAHFQVTLPATRSLD